MLFRAFSTLVFKRFIRTKQLSSMDKIYFRRLENSEKFQVSFHLVVEEFNVNRQFNFDRRAAEPLSDFLVRVKANVEKVVHKKASRKRKKSNPSETDFQPEPVEVSLTKSGEKVSETLPCEEVFFKGEHGTPSDLVVHLLGKSFPVVINCPWVDALALPSSIMAGLPVYPSKLEMSFGVREKSKGVWYTGDNNPNDEEWQEVGTGFIYIPSQGDIHHVLKFICVPSDGTVVGPEAEVISIGTVQAGPGVCPFHARHMFTCKPAQSDWFRVISYNILADIYAETEAARLELFPYCPPYAMALDYRKQLYIQELLGYRSDLICLQEVDSKVFDYDLSFVLGTKGLKGVFAIKGTAGEGLATFYNTEKFSLMSQYRCLLGEDINSNPLFSAVWDAVKENEQLFTRVQKVGTVIQAVILKSEIVPNQILIVGNTHLYFHPDADHIRLLQGGMLMIYLQDLFKKTKENHPEANVSLVVCGDFNSTPDCGIYRLMTANFIPSDCYEWKNKEGEVVDSLELNQPFNMDSAYGTPAFTNYTTGFSGCLDYIYYDCDKLTVQQVVPLPSEDEMKVHTAIPSVVVPSDHLALVADFSWK